MKVKNIMFSGFAAAILMGTVDANAALSIASKDYVDNQVSALSGANGAITSLQTRMTTAEGTLNTLTGDGAGSVAKAEADAKSYADTKAGAAETAAKAYADGLATNYDAAGAAANALQSAKDYADGKFATSEYVGTLPSGLPNGVDTVTEYVAHVATSVGGDTTSLNNRLDTLEGAADVENSVANKIATALADYTTTANLTKASVGLGNVDNTSDADKPISTATQAALDLKANQSTTYTKTEVDNLLSAKQGTLTQTQLAAANSGIDATAKASYDAVVNTMGGTCTSESDYCALVKGPNGTITWVEITNPFTAGTSGNNNNDNPNE